MGWNKRANLAQYESGNWSNFVKKVATGTAEEAMRVAFVNPDITFFFFCRQGISLDKPPAAQYGPFNAGDAVFFKGQPWYGNALQCDSYEKTPISTIYINHRNNAQFQEIGSYVLKDGAPAIDVVCIFAASYATNSIPMLRANNNVPVTKKPFNPNIQDVLSSGLVKTLQDKGTVSSFYLLPDDLTGSEANGSSKRTEIHIRTLNRLKLVDPPRLCVRAQKRH